MFHTFEFICQLGPYKLWVKDPFHQITRRLATNSLWPEQQQYGFEKEWTRLLLITSLLSQYVTRITDCLLGLNFLDITAAFLLALY